MKKWRSRKKENYDNQTITTSYYWKQEYETVVIRAHGECKDEMWGDNRDKAAVVIDKISQAGMTSPSDFGRMNL